MKQSSVKERPVFGTCNPAHVGPGWLLVDPVELQCLSMGGIAIPSNNDFTSTGRNVDRVKYGVVVRCGEYVDKTGHIVEREKGGWPFPLEAGSIVELRCATPYETLQQGSDGAFVRAYQTSDVIQSWAPGVKPSFWPSED